MPNSAEVGVIQAQHLELRQLKLIQNRIEKPEFHENIMQNGIGLMLFSEYMFNCFSVS